MPANNDALIARVQELLHCDPDTGIFTRRIDRGRYKIGTRIGRRQSCGYRRIKIDGYDYLEHRLLWLYVHGRWPVVWIDHINGNRADNRICNLREATPSENLGNSKISYNNKAGYKGVSFDKGRRLWRAAISPNRRQKILGYFDNPKDAHVAYCKAASKFFGQFANPG